MYFARHCYMKKQKGRRRGRRRRVQKGNEEIPAPSVMGGGRGKRGSEAASLKGGCSVVDGCCT